MVGIAGFETLKTTREFSRIYKSAKVKHDAAFVVFYKKNAVKKVGFVASKKVGNAVQRNRAKRLLRAHFVNISHMLESGSYIFVAKHNLLESGFDKTKQRFKGALHEAGALQLSSPREIN